MSGGAATARRPGAWRYPRPRVEELTCMAEIQDRGPGTPAEAHPVPSGSPPIEATADPSPTAAVAEHRSAAGTSPTPNGAGTRAHPWRKRLLLAGAAVGLAIAGYVYLMPRVETMLTTVST